METIPILILCNDGMICRATEAKSACLLFPSTIFVLCCATLHSPVFSQVRRNWRAIDPGFNLWECGFLTVLNSCTYINCLNSARSEILASTFLTHGYNQWALCPSVAHSFNNSGLSHLIPTTQERLSHHAP